MSQDLPNEFTQMNSGSDDERVSVAILNHQKHRFALLWRLLKSNPEITVVIPFDGTDKSLRLEHGLGKGKAIPEWNDENKSESSIDNLTALVNRLMSEFPTRVKYGIVGAPLQHVEKYSATVSSGYLSKLQPDEKNKLIGYSDELGLIGLNPPSDKVYHVWGANVNNWNLPVGTMIYGGQQANGMGTQQIGIFGVITTPLYVNNPPDNLGAIMHYNHLSEIITQSRLNNRQKLELAQLINNNNNACLKCIADGINSMRVAPITTLITILHNSQVITVDKFREYNETINQGGAQSGAHMKYLKYKQKYLALKKSLNIF